MAADILALSRAELENAKRFFRGRLLAHLGTVAISVVALLFENAVSYLLAAAAVLTELAAWWCRLQAANLQAHADRGIRRALLIKSFGKPKSDLDAADITVEFSQYARAHAAEWADGDYWAAQMTPGPVYLRANLQESAFYSSRLMREAGRRTTIRLTVFALVVAAVLIAMLLLDAGDTGVVAARVVTVLMGVLVSTDELSVLLAYRQGHEVAKRTCERLQHAGLSDPAQALALYTDYASVMTSAPPIPTPVYEDLKDEIAEAWQLASAK